MAALAAAGGSNTPPVTPQSAAGSSHPSIGPPRVTAGAPQPPTVSPPSTVAAGKFYPHQGSSVSGTNNSTTGGTIGNAQATFRAPQATADTTGTRTGTKVQGTNSSSLPPDVLRKIEENKRKAQERREFCKKMREEQGTGAPQAPSTRNSLQTTTPGSSASSGTPAARNLLRPGGQTNQSSTGVVKSSPQPSGKEGILIYHFHSTGGGR